MSFGERFTDIEQEVRALLTSNPEEAKHATDTLEFLVKLKPDVDDVIKIAALGHDIERALKPWTAAEKDYKLDKDFREKHARRSADIIDGILHKYPVDPIDAARVYTFILKHEWGGGEVDLLRDADSLANFIWCDDMYGIEKMENLRSVAEKMYDRMSRINRGFIHTIKFKHEEVERMIKGLCKV